jgi:thioredoxin reductase (NADPH)
MTATPATERMQSSMPDTSADRRTSTAESPDTAHSPDDAHTPEDAQTFEVAVIGGGAGGLAASVALARSLRSVVVIDAGQPRNSSSPHAHNLLGNEGINPRDLIAKGRAEAEGYGVTFVDATVTDARTIAANDAAGADPDAIVTDARTIESDPNPAEPAAEHRFELTTSARVIIRAKRIIIATGLTDELPNIPGLAERWGETVLHCPYCHGYEVRGQHIGVVGSTAMSYHQAMLFSQLSDGVSFIRHDAPEPDAEQTKMLDSLGIEYVDAHIAEVSHTEAGAVLALTANDARDGSVNLAQDSAEAEAETETQASAETAATRTFDSLTVSAFARANSELFTQLGGTVADHPSGMGSYIPTHMAGQTDVPGVWAVGNSADVSAMVVASAASGVLAGAQVNADLIMSSIG